MRIALIVAVASVIALAFASSAAALKTHLFLDPPGRIEVPSPGFAHSPGDITVNQITHHAYVLSNPGNPTQSRVYNLGPEGKLDPVTPVLATPTPGELFAVAVDNSGDTRNGDIYVVVRNELNPSGGVVQQYGQDGAATGVSISEASIPPNGTLQGGGLPPVTNTGAFQPRSVAVGPAGNVLVTDNGAGVPAGAHAIDEFAPDGTFIAQRAVGRIGIGVQGLEVGSGGSIYVAVSERNSAEPGFLAPGLHQLNAAGECAQVSCAPLDPEPAFDVAVDRSEGTLLVTQANPPRFSEYDSSGLLLGTSGEGVLRSVDSGLSKVAVDEASGKVFVGDKDSDSTAGNFDIFGAVVILPDVTANPASAVGANGATLNGEVSAAGGTSASCAFQYADEASFEVEGFSGAESAPCSPSGPFTGESSVSVHAELTGLNGGTTYHFRLVGSNSIGANPSRPLEFTTEGPSVRSQAFSSILETGATLEAVIDPRGASTTYRFQYVDQAAYEADRAQGSAHDGFASAAEVPVGGGGIGGGSVGVPVSQAVTNLTPGTGYHFRVVAINANGRSVGPDSQFRTFPPAVSLPDGRAYEQVTPVDKQGADARGEANGVQAARDGNAVTFVSNVGFPGGLGAQEFGSYQANRAPDGSGWSLEGLLPTAQSGPFGKVLGWNEDLTETYVSNKQTITPPAIYLRRRGGGLTEIALGGSERYPFTYADASSDGATVLFESKSSPLVPGAVGGGKANLYVWDRSSGTLALAGVLNNERAPRGGAFAGPYDWFIKEQLLENGNPVPGGAFAQYYTRVEHALSGDGSRVFFTAGETGQLYVRLNPLKPQSPTNRAGVCEDKSLACTIRISAPAEGLPDPNLPAAFVGATSDGDTAYFLDEGKLTSNATPSGGLDLYSFDIATGQLTDLTPDATDLKGADVQGVMGISSDGEYIYFVANGRSLAAGAEQGTCHGARSATEGECNLYLLHGGQTQLVARLAPKSLNPETSDLRDWTPTARLSAGSEEASEATSRLSPDGRTLLFRSVNQLTDYDNDGVPELYRFRVGQPLICISCNPSNTPPDGAAGLQSIAKAGPGAKIQAGVLTRNLVMEGDRIFFDTPDRLVAKDTNGANDVYEWEADSVGSCESSNQNGGCLYLISSGSSPFPSFFGDASATGDDAFFFTTQSLVRQDRDELVDVYDARIGGGIASQNAVLQNCSGEDCAEAPAAAPSTPGVGSTSTQQGNVKAIHCRKGFHRRNRHGKERCVKVKKRKHHHRRAKKHKRGQKHKNRQGKHGKGKMKGGRR
jgi:hypothetical protein